MSLEQQQQVVAKYRTIVQTLQDEYETQNLAHNDSWIRIQVCLEQAGEYVPPYPAWQPSGKLLNLTRLYEQKLRDAETALASASATVPMVVDAMRVRLRN